MRMRNRLLALHQIGNDLSTVESFDDLCRQAVVFGCQILECKRVSLWFRRGNSMVAGGSFGMDESGKARDERARLITLNRAAPMGEVLADKRRLLIQQDCVLRNDKGEEVGRGMHAIAALWNGSRVIGCICIDNLLDRRIFSAEDLDILCMYAALIGHLAFGKKTADELKKSVKEKEILLREIQHRVKNNLQVISSLLNLQAAYIRDPHDAELFRQTQARIKSMAKAYDAFRPPEGAREINMHNYITGIIHDLFQFYQVDPSSIVMRWEGGHESFSLSQAIPCSLIVNELVMNALKHGFQQGQAGGGQPKGELLISVQRREGSIAITIANNGVPFPDKVDVNHPHSLGLQLVNALVSQLNGTLSMDNTRGTRFTVTFPEKIDGGA